MMLHKMGREVIAGITTFLTMAYIVVVNPAILSTPGTGIPFSGALTATVLVCFTMTLFMGLFAKLPFGVAPGMGLNAFFTYAIIINRGVPWPAALGIVFWAGALFLLVSATPLTRARGDGHPVHSPVRDGRRHRPAARVHRAAERGLRRGQPGDDDRRGAARTIARCCTLVGLFICVRLSRNHNPFAYLASMLVVTACAWAGGWVDAPASWVSAPDFSSVFLKLDVWGALRWSLAPAIVTVMMTDMFDSLSTFIGVAHAANLVDARGEPLNLRRGSDRGRRGHARRGPLRQFAGHRVRREHRGHPHGRPHGHDRRGHRVLFPSLPVHRPHRRDDSSTTPRPRS